MRVVLGKAWRRLTEEGIWVHLLSLVDDLLLICEPACVDRAVQVLADELGEAGLKLNLSKSAALVPESDRDGTEPSCIRTVPLVRGGLPALGCAYGGEYETVLGPYSVAVEPARKRLQQAEVLAAECAKYRHHGCPDATWQASWFALRRVVAKALVYDVRTLEPGAAQPLAEAL